MVKYGKYRFPDPDAEEIYEREIKRSRRLTAKERNAIKDRDNWRCVKCTSEKNLEVDHIFPIVYGGQNNPGNLATLCRSCHKEAPDRPIEWFEWAKTGVPPQFDKHIQFTGMFLNVMSVNKELKQLFIDDKKEELEEFMVEWYKDTWMTIRCRNGPPDIFGEYWTKWLVSKNNIEPTPKNDL